MNKKLKVFEAFAGYGSQSISLTNIGVDYEVVGISEIEPDAIIAYATIKGFDLNQSLDVPEDIARQILINKNIGYDFKKNKSIIPKMNKSKLIKLYNADKLTKNYGDISLIDANDLPDFDYFTYSFPCQDISVAGEKKGLEGTRSGLLYECEKIIEIKKPKYLLMENVKNLVGKQFKADFDLWIDWLGEKGYNSSYKVLNAKDFGIPQNRERIFAISILKEFEINSFEFPKAIPLKMKIKDLLDEQVDESRYYSKKFIIVNKGHKAEFIDGAFDQGKRIYSENQPYMNCITARDRGVNNVLVNNETRARKITSLEALRFMGLGDEYYLKFKNEGLTDGSIFKLAGNSIVINVLDNIHISLFKSNM